MLSKANLIVAIFCFIITALGIIQTKNIDLGLAILLIIGIANLLLFLFPKKKETS